MANIYKNDKVSLTNTDLTALYTVPSNSRAIVKSINVAEDAAGSAVVKVTLTNAASSATFIDLTIALELEGTVYKVVRSVLVKLTLSFLYIFAILS